MNMCPRSNLERTITPEPHGCVSSPRICASGPSREFQLHRAIDPLGRLSKLLCLTRCLVATLIVAALSASAQGQASVTLAWDAASPSGGISGYRLYKGGASGTYTNIIAVGNATTATSSNLVSGASYYFAVTAVGTNGLESDYSSEVSYTVPLPTNSPPTIALTAPLNGAAYTAPATISLAASVTANGHTISQVQFYNGATLLGAVAAAPYSFSWNNVSIGAYSLSAKLVYDSGSTVTSTPASVTVTNVLLPSIALTSPANGAVYTAPATISLAASVTASGHTISQVQFYNGATLLGSVASAPYSFSWKNVSTGAYSLSAKLVYDSGSTVSSAAAGVTVRAKKRPRLGLNFATAGTGAASAIVQPPPLSIILNVTDGEPGQIYNIQSSPDLQTWTQIGTTTLDAIGNSQVTNSMGVGPIGFYRLHGQ
jgi:hypothetical protein